MPTMRCRRRGAMYLAVLMTAMIVTVLGVAGLAVTRVKVRSSGHALDMAAARFYAESAIELALLEINGSPVWYASISPDTWRAEHEIGRGTYSWKLASDAGQHHRAARSNAMRLYGMGRCGEAVRIYSVVVEPDASTTSLNLLSNAGMESGVSPWVDPGDCDLAIDTSNPHRGSACLCVKNRGSYDDGPQQNVADEVLRGNSYTTEVWVRMQNSSEAVELVLWVNLYYTWYRIGMGYGTAGTDWTKITGAFDANWPWDSDTVYWKIETTFGNQNFFVDDAVLLDSDAGGQLTTTAVAIPGTWRRETSAALD